MVPIAMAEAAQLLMRRNLYADSLELSGIVAMHPQVVEDSVAPAVKIAEPPQVRFGIAMLFI